MKTILLLLAFTPFISRAQQPVRFEPGILGEGNFGLSVSPDSKTALWVHSNGRRDTLQIMQSENKDGKWQPATAASFSNPNGRWKDIDPIFSPDGKIVLFQSNRPVPGHPDRKGFDIWAVKRKGGRWTEPLHLGDGINTDSSESFASMARNKNIYFMKVDKKLGKGSADIYVSEYTNGNWQTPVVLEAPVNTERFESNPFISPEEDYLIYFSDKPGGPGDVDLYISFRINGKWTSPQVIETPVNSAIAEFCPFYHEKEKRLYFARQEENKAKGKGNFIENCYWVPFDVETYRKKAVL